MATLWLASRTFHFSHRGGYVTVIELSCWSSLSSRWLTFHFIFIYVWCFIIFTEKHTCMKRWTLCEHVWHKMSRVPPPTPLVHSHLREVGIDVNLAFQGWSCVFYQRLAVSWYRHTVKFLIRLSISSQRSPSSSFHHAAAEIDGLSVLEGVCNLPS